MRGLEEEFEGQDYPTEEGGRDFRPPQFILDIGSQGCQQFNRRPPRFE
jgi:hypothetical protein